MITFDFVENSVAKFEPGDTIEDGLIICGKCRQPKEQIAPASVAKELGLKKIPLACACQRKRDEEEAWDKKKNLFDKQIRERWGKCGLNPPPGVSFEMDDEKNEKASRLSRRYVERWDSVKEQNIGLLFYGPCGIGKSFLAHCIANSLLDRCVSVAAANFSRIINIVQDGKDKQYIIDSLNNFDLLVLDDLGEERGSEFASEIVFSVVDARLTKRKPTIITTNLTMKDIGKPGSTRYERIFDRVMDMCPVTIQMTGESRRQENAKKRSDLALEILA